MERSGMPDDRLTGGTVLTLLTTAFKPKTDTSVTMHEFLFALLRVVRPEWERPRGNTFEQNASRYRSCQSHPKTYMLQCDAGFLDEFTNAIKTDYATLAERTSAVVNAWLDTYAKSRWLCQALLTLLSRDTSIANQDKLYAVPSGKPVMKQDLLASPSLCLDSLILGIWHYALTQRPDNEKGHETFLRWHKPKRTQASRWVFEREQFNADPTLTPTVTRWADYEQVEEEDMNEDTAENAFDADVIEAEIIDEDVPNQEKNSAPPTQEPTPASMPQPVFQQFGSHNIQIGNIGTINFGSWG